LIFSGCALAFAAALAKAITETLAKSNFFIFTPNKNN
jgi:hypothetical protein